MTDDLTTLIENYRASCASFNAREFGDDGDARDQFAAATYEPAIEAIVGYDGAAQSMDEALLALDLANEEVTNGFTAMVGVLIRAAAAYLRGAS
jgi:hypothetical protein